MATTEQQNILDASAVNIRVAAAQVSRRYQRFTSYADLYQEACLWVVLHPGAVTERLLDGRRGSTRLTGQIAKHLDGVGRAEKAETVGYALADEAFYNVATIEAALPSVWDVRLMERPPPTDLGDFQKQKTDPSTAGTWLAVCVDVRGAWFKTTMNGAWKTALTLKHGAGLRNFQVADLMGVADSTVHAYVAKGTRSLINALGGSPPSKCGDDCECVGVRKILSNSQAAAMTDKGYDT